MTVLDERLREAHAAVPEPDGETVARVRERLEAAMAEPAPRRSRRRLVLAGTAAAALAIAAAVAIAVPPRASTDRSCPRPRRRPRSCARPRRGPTAACAPSATSRPSSGRSTPGEVLYQRNIFTLSTGYVDRRGRLGPRPDPRGYAISRTIPEEVWLAPDGSGRISYGRESRAVPAGPADGRAWRAAGAPDLDALMGPPRELGPEGAPLRAARARSGDDLQLQPGGGAAAARPALGPPARPAPARGVPAAAPHAASARGLPSATCATRSART